MSFFTALKNRYSISFLCWYIAAVCLCPFLARGEEIHFAENYLEKIVDGEVVGGGNSTLDINLLWNGVDPAEFDDLTEITISIGQFQFNQILGGADDYEEGATSVEFDDRDGQGSGSRFNVSWTTKSFTISGLTFNTNDNPTAENYFGAKDYVDEDGSIQDSYEVSISFGDFSTNTFVAVTGGNTVTTQTVEDEELTRNNVHITGEADLPPPDSTRPTVSITSPASNGRLLTPLITGKASDNRGVAEVFYQIGTNDFALASGTTNWSAAVALALGTNTVKVKSVDLAGNESSLVTRTFFYVVTSPLAVQIVGEGSTSLTNGQPLELGKSYSITAQPAVSNVFLEWLGDNLNSASPTVTFVMSPAFSNPDFPLQANFIPNPFISAKGTFVGLFSNTNGVTPADAGFLTVTLKNSGAYSGKIFLEGSRYSISGLFDLAGRADKIISRRGKLPLNVHLRLDFEGGLFGSVALNGATSAVEAELAKSTTNSIKTKYTLLVPPGVDPAAVPGGYGFGCASIDLKNKLKFKGVLADGTTVVQSTFVSQTGRWPLFASLYRGKGVFLGWLSFTNEPASDVSGTSITWAKIAGATGKFYTNGFTLIGPMFGSEYLLPPFSATWAASSVEINGGNLTTALTNAVAVGPDNKLTITSTNNTALSVTPSSGLLKGKFINPATGKNASLKGALLQKQQLGAGFFLGTNQSGSFLLQPNIE